MYSVSPEAPLNGPPFANVARADIVHLPGEIDSSHSADRSLSPQDSPDRRYPPGERRRKTIGGSRRPQQTGASPLPGGHRRDTGLQISSRPIRKVVKPRRFLDVSFFAQLSVSAPSQRTTPAVGDGRGSPSISPRNLSTADAYSPMSRLLPASAPTFSQTLAPSPPPCPGPPSRSPSPRSPGSPTPSPASSPPSRWDSWNMASPSSSRSPSGTALSFAPAALAWSTSPRVADSPDSEPAPPALAAPPNLSPCLMPPLSGPSPTYPMLSSYSGSLAAIPAPRPSSPPPWLQLDLEGGPDAGAPTTSTAFGPGWEYSARAPSPQPPWCGPSTSIACDLACEILSPSEARLTWDRPFHWPAA